MIMMCSRESLAWGSLTDRWAVGAAATRQVSARFDFCDIPSSTIVISTGSRSPISAMSGVSPLPLYTVMSPEWVQEPNVANQL